MNGFESKPYLCQGSGTWLTANKLKKKKLKQGTDL